MESAGAAKVSPDVSSHAGSQQSPETRAEGSGFQPLYSHRPELRRLGQNWLFLFVGAEGWDRKTLQGTERGQTQKNIVFVRASQRRAWDAPFSPKQAPLLKGLNCPLVQGHRAPKEMRPLFGSSQGPFVFLVPSHYEYLGVVAGHGVLHIRLSSQISVTDGLFYSKNIYFYALGALDLLEMSSQILMMPNLYSKCRYLQDHIHYLML